MNIQDQTYLFTITERFVFEGRGIVVAPGIPWTEGTPSVKKGSPLILRTPLGDIIETFLRDIEMLNYRPGGKILEATPFSLPKNLHKFDVPIGTEVYLATQNTKKMKTLLLLTLSTLLTFAERKPNIILIYADDLGMGVLSRYGQEHLRTPHIDSIAEQGLTFKLYYEQSNGVR